MEKEEKKQQSTWRGREPLFGMTPPWRFREKGEGLSPFELKIFTKLHEKR